MNDDYVAGQCNIGKAEINVRKTTGYLWLGALVLSIAINIALGMPRYSRLLIVIPLFLSMLNLWQARNHYCVYYGTRGVFNTTEDLGSVNKVTDKVNLQTDRIKSLSVAASILFLAIVLTLLFFALG